MSSPQRHRVLVQACWALLGLAPAGCTHYHYYGNAIPVSQVPAGTTLGSNTSTEPVYVAVAPPKNSSFVRTRPAYTMAAPAGSICDVPATSSAPQMVVVQGAPAGSSSVSSRPRGRQAWRRPDPEAMGATRITGNVDDEIPVR
jgi:hypothetical protein